MSCANRPSRQNSPKFLPTPTNITVHRGEVAELHCHIKNLGPRMVSDINVVLYIRRTFVDFWCSIECYVNKLSEKKYVTPWQVKIFFHGKKHHLTPKIVAVSFLFYWHFNGFKIVLLSINILTAMKMSVWYFTCKVLPMQLIISPKTSNIIFVLLIM